MDLIDPFKNYSCLLSTKYKKWYAAIINQAMNVLIIVWEDVQSKIFPLASWTIEEKQPRWYFSIKHILREAMNNLNMISS